MGPPHLSHAAAAQQLDEAVAPERLVRGPPPARLPVMGCYQSTPIPTVDSLTRWALITWVFRAGWNIFDALVIVLVLARCRLTRACCAWCRGWDGSFILGATGAVVLRQSVPGRYRCPLVSGPTHHTREGGRDQPAASRQIPAAVR